MFSSEKDHKLYNLGFQSWWHEWSIKELVHFSDLPQKYMENPTMLVNKRQQFS